MRLRAVPIAVGIFAFAFSPVVAQPPAERLAFEVASIHRSPPDATGGGIKPLPGGYGYIAQNFPVKLMISLMYKAPMRQIAGAPEWLNTERFDIQAKADRPYSVDDLHIMFQNLLADRFGLKFHIEAHEGPVFFLTVDKSGLKMKPNETPQDFKIPVTPVGPGSFTGVRVPMPYLCWFIGQQLQSTARPVIDKTGLSGNFDFLLSFAPELASGVARDTLPPELINRPALLDAVREQLGLKLETGKGPVADIVIDHVERPSDN